MDFDVQFKVNPVGEIRKMRETMYSDPYSWVEELIQNAQRAKANSLYIDVTSDCVTFTDDGMGCDDPQIIFEKSSSGWHDSDTKAENPFGEGFFSVVMLGDEIIINSRNWQILFYPGQIIENGTVEGGIISKTTNDFINGFRVKVRRLRDGYLISHVEDRIRKVATYIPRLTIYLNGNEIPKKDFKQTDGSKFAMEVDNKHFKGWVRPYRLGSNHDGWDYQLKVFSNGRFVTDLHLNGISGTINLESGVVDLRSPDRREIIQNPKYTRFRENLKSVTDFALLQVVIDGSDSDLDKYADIISENLSVSLYRKYIKFIVQSGNYDLIKELMESSKEEKSKTVSQILSEPKFGVGNLENISLAPEPIVPVVNQNCDTNRRGLSVDKVEEMTQIYYVKQDEIMRYQDNIKLAEYYSVPVVIIRNSLELKVIGYMKNALHIENLTQNVKLRIDMDNVGVADKSEIRAIWILSLIEKALSLKSGTFRIGDIKPYLEYTITGGSDVVKTEELEGFALAYNGLVYLNRKYLKKEMLSNDDFSKLYQSDIAFVMLNLDSIAHELAHIIHGTVDNTPEHFKHQLRLQEEIIKVFYCDKTAGGIAEWTGLK